MNTRQRLLLAALAAVLLGATGYGMNAANSLPVAVLTSDITVPVRRFTCRGCVGSSSRTIVGPRLPHTATAMLCSVCSARSAMNGDASLTGSSRCNLASFTLSRFYFFNKIFFCVFNY